MDRGQRFPDSDSQTIGDRHPSARFMPTLITAVFVLVLGFLGVCFSCSLGL